MNNEFYKLKIARLERELAQSETDHSETLATLFKMLNEKIALVAQIKNESENIAENCDRYALKYIDATKKIDAKNAIIELLLESTDIYRDELDALDYSKSEKKTLTTIVRENIDQSVRAIAIDLKYDEKTAYNAFKAYVNIHEQFFKM